MTAPSTRYAKTISRAPPLQGVTVIELSELLPGPYATRLLLRLGADVLKVERPGGDSARALAPALFAILNRGKRSLRLDLKQKAGREILYRLVAKADILVEGYRPGVAARLGCDYETLCRVNPSLIYASLSGYGQTGPYARRPGHDLNYLAATGIIAISGRPDGPPSHDIGVPVGDLAGSMFAVTSILAALIQRGATGEGQYLDVSISDALVSWMVTRFGVVLDENRSLAEAKRELLTRPAYGIFETADTQYITIAAVEDVFWERLVAALELHELAGSDFARHAARCARADVIARSLAKRIRERPLAHWVQLLERHDVPFSPVSGPRELLEDPHFGARGLFVRENGCIDVAFPVPLAGTRAESGPEPELGAHSEDVLTDLGYVASDIARFVQNGVI